MQSDDDCMTGRHSDRTQSQQLLQRIADTIGIDSTAFSDEAAAPTELTQWSELVALWVKIEDATLRERLLRLARELVAQADQ